MPDTQSCPTVSGKVSSQPQPLRNGASGVGCRDAVNDIVATACESTVAEVEVCRCTVAVEGPCPDSRNAITSPGAAESGQQYPSIGRSDDSPVRTLPSPGW